MTGCGAITLCSERERVSKIKLTGSRKVVSISCRRRRRGAAWVRRLIKFGQTTVANALTLSHPLANSAGIVNCLIASSGMEKSAPAWESGRKSWGPSSVDALSQEKWQRVVCYPRAIVNYISAARRPHLPPTPEFCGGWLNDCVTRGSKAIALLTANSSQGLENLEQKKVNMSGACFKYAFLSFVRQCCVLSAAKLF